MTFRTLLMVLLALVVATGYVVILTDMGRQPDTTPPTVSNGAETNLTQITVTLQPFHDDEWKCFRSREAMPSVKEGYHIINELDQSQWEEIPCEERSLQE